jgi:hypothetical protein
VSILSNAPEIVAVQQKNLHIGKKRYNERKRQSHGPTKTMLPVAKRLGNETKTNKQKRVTNNSVMHKFSHFNPETCLFFDSNSAKFS